MRGWAVPKVRSRRCLACDLTFDVMVWEDGTVAALDRDNELLDASCPRCGSVTFEPVIAMPLPCGVNGYPYFDRGLGCTVESPRHRLQVAASRGLAPVDGRLDVEGYASKAQAHIDEVGREFDEYNDRLDHSPEFAGYRQAMARQKENA